MSDEVLATVVYNGSLYAAGQFLQADGTNIAYVARYNGSGWEAFSTSQPNGEVRALAVHEGFLVIGGTFTLVGSLSANSLARWSSSTGWQAYGDGVQLPGAPNGVGTVYALATVHPSSGVDTLFVGGRFDRVNDVIMSNVSGSLWGNIAKGYSNGSGITWAKVGEGTSSTVEALRPAPGTTDLYVGGEFHQVRNLGASSNLTSDLFAKWVGGSWTNYISSDLETSGEDKKVSAIEVWGSTLYIGGDFVLPTGGYLAKWNSGWTALTSSPNSAVQSIMEVGDTTLVVGGGFTQIGSSRFESIARWDGTQWKRLGGGFKDNTFTAPVDAVTANAGVVYVGGTFTAAGDVDANHIAGFDGNSWYALGSGVDGTVNDLAVFGGKVYAGGSFSHANGGSASNIASWDPSSSTWSVLGSGTDGTSGYVSALGVFGSYLVVGGSFTSAGGTTLANANVAEWSGSAWSSLGTSGLSGIPVGFAVYNNDLYAASGPVLYHLNPSTNVWEPKGATSSLGTLYSIAVYSGGLVVGGNFTTMGGTSAINVALWNGSWHAMGSGLGSGGSGIVRGLSAIDQDIAAVGEFSDHASRWDGTSWNPMATSGTAPLDGNGIDAATVGNHYYVVGSFWRAGGKPSVHIADYRDDITPPDPISDLNVTSIGRHSVALSWTFTGDDGNVGTATSYELRYATSPVGDGNPGNILESGAPGASGTTICTEVDGLSSCTNPYYFGVKLIDDAGNYSFSNSPSATPHCSGGLATCGGNRPQASQLKLQQLEFSLGSPYPNPQHGSLRIQYSGTGQAPVSIRVFDVSGRVIRSLVDEDRRAGEFTITWDGKDDHGTQCNPGVYFYRMQAGTWRSDKRVVLLGR